MWDVRIHGQKDKKAITFQDVSVKNVEPARYLVLHFFFFVFFYTTLHTIVTILSFFRLLECRPKLLNYNIDIGNFRYAKYPVIIGAHSGNHFDIMLRDLAPRDGSSDEQLEGIVSAALDDIKENGFINYFGQQRYGVCDTLPLIGLAILRKDMVCLINYSWVMAVSRPRINYAIDFQGSGDLFISHLTNWSCMMILYLMLI